MNLTRVFDILPFQNSKYPNVAAVAEQIDGKWKKYSIEECQIHIDEYSKMLFILGFRKGDFLIIWPELASVSWLFLDLAAQQIGGVVIPIHASFKKEQISHILQETQAKLAFVQSISDVEALKENLNAAYLEVFPLWVKDRNNLDSLSHKYKKNSPIDLATLKQSVQPSDLATIIYTSGTTGVPKGVMLTHANLMSNLHSMMPLLPVDSSKRSISFLPYSHIFERTAIFTYIAMGCSVHFIKDRNDLLDAFKEVQPHFFTAVPRILEKIYAGVLTYQARQNFVYKKIIDWALKIGMAYKEYAGFRPIYSVKQSIAKTIAFNKLHRILGGKVEAVIVGAAHLQPNLGKIFAASGIQIREGYGMTETSPAISFNRFQPGLNRFGTVGVPVPGVQVKIEEPNEEGEGEIVVKGDNVMQGYFKNEVASKAVFTEDGWFKTGDVGKFIDKRFLKITDRKKDIFKTSSGKYIAPQPLEKRFEGHPLIDQIMVIGFQKPYCVALIKPNFLLLEHWANEHQVHWTSPQYMVINIKIRQKMEAIVEELNGTLPSHQKIRQFHLFFKEWSVESGELSYTLKPIRSIILKQYEKEIVALYK